MKSVRIWLLYTKYSLQTLLSKRLTAVIFILAKMLRISLFLIFLSFLFRGTNGIGSYTSQQIVFFYLTFVLIDELTQFFFREVYRFRPLIVKGDFDYVLSKPINPLLRVLLGGADFLDSVVIIFVIIAVGYYGMTFISSDFIKWIMYIFFVINALAIAASFHIFVLGLGIITTSVEHLVMVYRDISSMLRIPVDLYMEPIRSILTFVVPLGIMLTFPPKVLMNALSPELIFVSLLVSFTFVTSSLLFWRYCLNKYQSASS
jgi:ABC-2 type transport system permease protein